VKTSGPTSSGFAVCVANGTKIYCGYGMSGANYYDEWKVYDTLTRTWSNLSTTNGPGSRSNMVGVVSNGVIYVGLGETTGPVYKDDWYTYTIATDTWASMSKTNGPTARGYASAAVNAGKIYVGLGYDGSSALDSWYVYDIAGGTWSQPMSTTDAPPGTYSASCVAHNGVVYVGLGYVAARTDNWYTYTIATNTWASMSKTSGPTARNRAAIAVDTQTSEIYCGTGVGDSGNLDTWYKYSISGGTWASVSNTSGPTARGAASAAYANGRVYCGLGADDNWYTFTVSGKRYYYLYTK